jgi:hypothetical protein
MAQASPAFPADALTDLENTGLKPADIVPLTNAGLPFVKAVELAVEAVGCVPGWTPRKRGGGHRTARVIAAAAAMLTAGASVELVASLTVERELGYACDLLDLGMHPAEVARLGESTWLEQVLGAVTAGVTSDRVAALVASGADLRTAAEAVQKGMPQDLLDGESEDTDTVEMLVVLKETGLSWDDARWLLSQQVPLGHAHSLSAQAIETGLRLAALSADERRLLAGLYLLGPWGIADLLPLAAAAADRPWAGTFLSLVKDRHLVGSDASLASLVVTARALEPDPSLPAARVPVEPWRTPPRLHVPPRRTVARVGELSAGEAQERARLSRAGVGAPWPHLQPWLQAGLDVSNACAVASWVGSAHSLWRSTDALKCGTAPVPPAADLLVAALTAGATVDDVRLVSSAFTASGPVGPFAAAAALSCGASREQVLEWLSKGVDVASAGLLTGFGVPASVIEEYAGNAAGSVALLTALWCGASVEQAPGLVGVLTPTWVPRLDGVPQGTNPFPVPLLEALAQAGLETDAFDDIGLRALLPGGGLPLDGVRLSLVLHGRLHEAGDDDTLAAAMAYAAAVCGQPWAERVVTAVPALESAWPSPTGPLTSGLKGLASATRAAIKGRSVKVSRTSGSAPSLPAPGRAARG